MAFYMLKINRNRGERGGGELLRERDCMLSEKFLEIEKKGMNTQKKWGSVNRCPIYQNTLSLANITRGSGLKIDINYLSGDIY